MPEAGRQGLSRRRLAKGEGSLPVAGPRRPGRILHIRRERMSRCALDKVAGIRTFSPLLDVVYTRKARPSPVSE